MGFGSAVKKVAGGVELTHPRASLGWFIPAIVAVVVILAAIAVGKWLYGKVSAPVSGVVSKMPVVGSMTSSTQTTDSAGWIY